MGVQENKALIQRLSDELWNERNLGVVDDLLAPDWVDHNAPPGIPAGPQGLKALATGIQAAFSDGRSSIDDLVAEGDKVAWRWTYCGRHTSEFQGIPPTHRQVALTGITIDRIAGGKLVERWSVTDMLGFLQPLGVVPTSEQEPAQDR